MGMKKGLRPWISTIVVCSLMLCGAVYFTLCYMEEIVRQRNIVIAAADTVARHCDERLGTPHEDLVDLCTRCKVTQELVPEQMALKQVMKNLFVPDSVTMAIASSVGDRLFTLVVSLCFLLVLGLLFGCTGAMRTAINPSYMYAPLPMATYPDFYAAASPAAVRKRADAAASLLSQGDFFSTPHKKQY